MHDYLDPVVRQREQEMRLDQLEALVGEGRRVDGDLRAHVPRRMRQRIGGLDVLPLLTRPPPERTAPGGEHEGMNLVRPAAPETPGRRPGLPVHPEPPPPA